MRHINAECKRLNESPASACNLLAVGVASAGEGRRWTMVFANEQEEHSMSGIRRFDHVGIIVRDLDAVIAFFEGLGLELEGRAFMEGEFTDTVIGIPNARTEIAMLRPPDGGAGLELSSFVRPEAVAGASAGAENELGLRSLGFEVDDLDGLVDRLTADGYQLVGGVGAYEGIWRMAHVRGPEGIIVALAERTDRSRSAGT
jgi:catechol 2,3-dioxygenase-like lactoylglutathione lyase family enzyme